MIFTALMAVCGVACVNAQVKEEFRQSQTRVQEPMQDVYIRPHVAEIQMIKETRSKWGPYPDLIQYDITQITQAMLENAKVNAAYRAAEEEQADIILGATFLIVNRQKGKGVDVYVNGYPGKYVKWHAFGDVKNGGAQDAEWVNTLFNGLTTRTSREVATREDSKTQSIKK